MKTFFVCVGVLVCLLGVQAKAQKKAPSGALAVAAGSVLQLGGTVSFDWAVENLRGNTSGPRIQVLCYQSSNLVYAEAQPASGSFLIGGASSPWLNDEPPADREAAAHCVADLFYFSYSGGQQQFNLLDSVEFDAAGL